MGRGGCAGRLSILVAASGQGDFLPDRPGGVEYVIDSSLLQEPPPISLTRLMSYNTEFSGILDPDRQPFFERIIKVLLDTVNNTSLKKHRITSRTLRTPDVVVPVLGLDPEAARRTQDPCIGDPRAAPPNTNCALGRPQPRAGGGVGHRKLVAGSLRALYTVGMSQKLTRRELGLAGMSVALAPAAGAGTESTYTGALDGFEDLGKAELAEQEVFAGKHSFHGKRGLPFLANHL